ncbi:hypothetical protein D3C72_1426300 [compost metagenome]
MSTRIPEILRHAELVYVQDRLEEEGRLYQLIASRGSATGHLYNSFGVDLNLKSSIKTVVLSADGRLLAKNYLDKEDE